MPPNPHSLMKGAKLNILVLDESQLDSLPPGMLPEKPMSLADLRVQGDTVTIETPWGDKVTVDLNQWVDRNPNTTYIGFSFGKHVKELEKMPPDERADFHRQLREGG